MMHRLAVAFGCLAITGGSAVGQTPPALASHGAWQVEYHPEMCVLSRTFGTGEGAMTLGLQTATSESTFMLVVLRPNSGSTAIRQGKLTVSADGVVLADKQPYASRVARAAGARVDTASLSRDMLPSIASAKRLSIATDKGPSVHLALAGTAKALAALEACERDLLVSWGFDMAARAKMAVKPKGNPGRFFGSDNYPPGARSKGESGRAVAVLNIGTDGHVDACRIAITSKSPSLDAATCQIATRRIVYTPARDAADQPIASQQYLAVNWQLEY
jgi:TonB family protein